MKKTYTIDLTAYADQQVRIAFFHSAYDYGGATYGTDVSTGWYIDEFEIWHGIPNMPNPETFANGWGDWYTDRGVWQVEGWENHVGVRYESVSDESAVGGSFGGGGDLARDGKGL